MTRAAIEWGESAMTQLAAMITAGDGDGPAPISTPEREESAVEQFEQS
jgi:hypothetical protein